MPRYGYASLPALPGTTGESKPLASPVYAFCVGVLHIMAAGSSAKSAATATKTRFWDAVLRAAEARLHERVAPAG